MRFFRAATLALLAASFSLPLAGVGCASRPANAAGEQKLLAAGQAVPALSGVDQHGETHTIGPRPAGPYVVYFYPKDATPGCTKEACAFRDAWERYQAAGVGVFGVSVDDRSSHEAFARKHELPFPLIADESGAWSRAFGVAKGLGFYERVSFLVSADGVVAKVYDSVDPGVHASEVLADAAALDKK